MEISSYASAKFSGKKVNASVSGATSQQQETTTQATNPPPAVAATSTTLSGLFGTISQQWQTFWNDRDANRLLSLILDDATHSVNEFSRNNSRQRPEESQQRLQEKTKLNAQPGVVKVLGDIALDKYRKQELSLPELLSVISYSDIAKDHGEALYKILTPLLKQKNPIVRQNLGWLQHTWNTLGTAHYQGNESAMRTAHLEILKGMLNNWSDVKAFAAPTGPVNTLDIHGTLYPHVKALLDQEVVRNPLALEEEDEARYLLLPLYARYTQSQEGQQPVQFDRIALKNEDAGPLLEEIAATFSDKPELAQRLQAQVTSLADHFFYEQPKSNPANIYGNPVQKPLSYCRFIQNTSAEDIRKYAELLLKHTNNFYPEILEIDMGSPEARALKDQILHQVEPGQLFTKANNRIFILKNLEQAKSPDTWLKAPKVAFDRDSVSPATLVNKGGQIGFEWLANDLFLIPLAGELAPLKERRNIISALANRCGAD